ncbi:MAG: DUF928 domain-containing protein [Desertifilum sp. SIO1I2]|nr:DUF928 domain-containing protein [Desertifilum sp. SIO1I2]
MKRHYLTGSFSLLALLASSTYWSASAVTFTPPPTNRAPSQATGGASRGNLFIPPSDNRAPSQATGGASRGNLFTPPSDNRAPSQATGGASRNLFTPPSDNSAPSQASGGASRNLFTPPSDNGSPNQASGGASRNLFTPPSDNSSPNQAAGGASRNNLFTPPSDNSAPQRASGGSSRVGTYYLNPSALRADGPQALIALLPNSFYGKTVSERPTFLVYIPASNAEEAIFSLKDEQGNMVYQMTLAVGGKSGTIAIQLPQEVPALTLGKNYQWLFALKLDGQLSPSTPYVDGWVQRVEPDAALERVLQQEDLLKQAEALGKNGIWYDCAAALVELHATQPTDATLTKHWEELLSSVGLKELTHAPLIGSAL